MAQISVVIPTYNGANTIARAIESVIAQTYSDWELIIVDDGSADATRQVVSQFTERDGRIKYFYQQNQGHAVARNAAMEHINTDYIAYIDDDDEWYPHKLCGQVEILRKHPELDLVLTDSVNIDIVENSKALYSQLHETSLAQITKRRLDGSQDVWLLDGAELPQIIYRKNFINLSTVMFRTSLYRMVGGCQAIPMPDLDLWIRMLEFGRFGYWSSITCNRYKIAKSLSRRSVSRYMDQIYVHSLHIQSEQFSSVHQVARCKLRQSYRGLARLYGREGKPRSALSTYKSSLRYGFDLQTAIFAFVAVVGPLPFTIGSKTVRRIRSLMR